MIPVLIGLASRMFSLATIGLSYVVQTAPQVAPGPVQVRPFAVWDGAWYVSIAEHGYHAAPLAQGAGGSLYDIAFFPAWPAVIKVLSLGGILPPDLVAGLVSNVLFIAACPVMFSVLRRIVDANIARWGLALLAFSPASFVFSLAYSESLFTLVSALALVSGRWGWLIAAQLTRLTGGAAAAALAIREWQQHRPQRAVVVVAIPAITFLSWCVAVAVIVGRPDAYLLGSPSWYANVGVGAGPATLFEQPVLGAVVVAYIGLLGVGALRIRRVAPELAFYAGLFLLSALILGRWETMARLALPAFPAFVGVALLVDRRRALRYSLLFVAACGQVGLAILVAGGGVAP